MLTRGKYTRPFAIIVASAMVSLTIQSCRSRAVDQTSTLSAADAKINPDSPFEFFTPSTWIPYAADQLMSQPLRGGFELFQLNMMDFSQFVGGFRASIEQQQDGAVLRSERWRVGVDVGPGALIQAAGNAATPVAIRIAGRREVTYTRAYSSHREAMGARPVTFGDLPLDSKRALKMSPGDFVSIPTNMGLTIGLEPLAAARPFAVSASVGAFWSGEFRINIYSQGHGFVRVKVSPSTARGLGAHAGVGARLDMFGYSPGQLINYDRQAERFFGLDFLSWSRTRVLAGERYVFDYIFNLNDASAQVAYDAIMSHPLRIKSAFQTLNVLRGRVNPDVVVADLTPAEYITQLDRDRPAIDRRVARVFNGNEIYQSDSSAGRFGTRLFRLNGARSLTTSKMRVLNDQATDTNPTFLSAIMMHSSRGQSSWFSPLRENQSIRATALFGSDSTFNTHNLRDLRFEISFSQNDLRAHELRAIRAAQMVIFGGYYSRLGLSDPSAIAGPQAKFQSAGLFSADSKIIEELRLQIERDPTQSRAIVQTIANNAIERLRQNRGSMEFLRDISEALARGELRDLDAELGTPIVNLTMSLGRVSTAEYLGELLRIMARGAASEMIVGGFMCDISLALKSPADVSIEETARDTPPFVRSFGNESDTTNLNRLNHATYSLTHMGYEN